MKRWLPVTLGIVAVVIGVVWTLQGLGYIGGSEMSDERIWAVIGPIVGVVGLVVIVVALRSGRRRDPRSP